MNDIQEPWLTISPTNRMAVWGRLMVCRGIHSFILLLIGKWRSCEQMKSGEQPSCWTGNTQPDAVRRKKPVEGGLAFCSVCGSTALTSHIWEVLGHPLAKTTFSWSGRRPIGDPQRLTLLGQWVESDQVTCGQSGWYMLYPSMRDKERHVRGRHMVGRGDKNICAECSARKLG